MVYCIQEFRILLNITIFLYILSTAEVILCHTTQN